MTLYRFIENSSDLTKEDLEWYSRVNSGTATGAKLLVASEDGRTSIEYIVFKRGTGRRQFVGSVVDWDKDTVVKADYDRFLRIRKSDGAVIDNDFEF